MNEEDFKERIKEIEKTLSKKSKKIQKKLGKNTNKKASLLDITTCCYAAYRYLKSKGINITFQEIVIGMAADIEVVTGVHIDVDNWNHAIETMVLQSKGEK